MSDSHLMDASRQWANRPADERFWGIDDLITTLEGVSSKVIGEPTPAPRNAESKKAIPTLHIKDLRIAGDGADLKLVGPSGVPVAMTNWCFGQLCTHLEAPAGYIGGLPTDLAVSCLDHGFKKHGSTPIKVLIQKIGEKTEARAITGPGYSRIWDVDIARRLQPFLDEGWRVPPARPSSNDDPRARAATEKECFDQGDFWGSIKPGDMIAPAGVYRGDRDSFIFLVNPERKIDDGSGNGGLMRGVFISNSEVGSRAGKVKTFMLENVCGNHICWGASDIVELKMVHKGRAKDIFPAEMVARMKKYREQGTADVETMIQAAKGFELASDREGVVDKLFGIKTLGLSKININGAFDMAEKWEITARCPPTTAWGFTHGLTRYSQTMGNADTRHLLDLAGGKILSMAVAG